MPSPRAAEQEYVSPVDVVIFDRMPDGVDHIPAREKRAAGLAFFRVGREIGPAELRQQQRKTVLLAKRQIILFLIEAVVAPGVQTDHERDFLHLPRVEEQRRLPRAVDA